MASPVLNNRETTTEKESCWVGDPNEVTTLLIVASRVISLHSYIQEEQDSNHWCHTLHYVTLKYWSGVVVVSI